MHKYFMKAKQNLEVGNKSYEQIYKDEKGKSQLKPNILLDTRP